MTAAQKFGEGDRVMAVSTAGDRRKWEGRHGNVVKIKNYLFNQNLDVPWVRVHFDGTKIPRYVKENELMRIG